MNWYKICQYDYKNITTFIKTRIMIKFYNISRNILRGSVPLLVVLGLVSCASTQTATNVETDGVYYNPSNDRTIAQVEAEEQDENDGMIRIGGAYFDGNGNGAEDLFYADTTATEEQTQTNVYINPGYNGSQSFSLEPTTDWGRYDGIDVNINYYGSSFYNPWGYYGLGYYSWYQPWGWNSWYRPYYGWGWNSWYSPYYAYGWGYPYYGGYHGYYGYGYGNGWYNGYYNNPRYLQRANPGTRPGMITTRNNAFGRNNTLMRNNDVRSNNVRAVRNNTNTVRETNATTRNNNQNTRVTRQTVNQNNSNTRVVRPTVDRTQIRTNNSNIRNSNIRQNTTPTRSNSTVRPNVQQNTRSNSNYSQPTRSSSSSMRSGSMNSGTSRGSGTTGGSRSGGRR